MNAIIRKVDEQNGHLSEHCRNQRMKFYQNTQLKPEWNCYIVILFGEQKAIHYQIRHLLVLPLVIHYMMSIKKP